MPTDRGPYGGMALVTFGERHVLQWAEVVHCPRCGCREAVMVHSTGDKRGMAIIPNHLCISGVSTVMRVLFTISEDVVLLHLSAVLPE